MKTPTITEFKTMCHELAPLALDVVAARTHAELERKRVDAYIAPIFDTFEFYVDREYCTTTRGERITSPDKLYLTTDEEQCNRFYAACDEAHKAQGYTLPAGHCPALVAEHAVIIAENALIKASAPAFGADPSAIYGETRKKWLDLVMGAGIKAASEQGMLCS